MLLSELMVSVPWRVKSTPKTAHLFARVSAKRPRVFQHETLTSPKEAQEAITDRGYQINLEEPFPPRRTYWLVQAYPI